VFAERKRLPFDPDSPGARNLLRSMRRMARSQEPMDVVLTEPLLRIAGERGALQGISHKIGDRLTVPRAEGESMIARGTARPA
jgi:hypothetical protein